MFDTHHIGNLHLQHCNPSTIHPLAFIPSSSFIEWLDTIGTSAGTNQSSKTDKED